MTAGKEERVPELSHFANHQTVKQSGQFTANYSALPWNPTRRRVPAVVVHIRCTGPVGSALSCGGLVMLSAVDFCTPFRGAQSGLVEASGRRLEGHAHPRGGPSTRHCQTVILRRRPGATGICPQFLPRWPHTPPNCRDGSGVASASGQALAGDLSASRRSEGSLSPALEREGEDEAHVRVAF